MRLIMMGTGRFAVPTLTAFYDSPHEILALVTRPPKPVHGKSRAEVNPMRELAESHGTPILLPESVNSDDARVHLAAYAPDLFVVCDYGQILARETLAIARFGGINLHASLLPKYRGAAPVNWAVYHGETETGNTIIGMTTALDAGPTLAQQRVPIDPEETADTLELRLALLGAPLVREVIDALASGTTTPLLQDRTQATKAPRLKKRDGEIDWTRPAEQIKNQVRAMQPWPMAFTHLQQPDREPVRLIIHRVAAHDRSTAALPGTVIESGKRLLISTGPAVQLQTIQPASKRPMTAEEFQRGHRISLGDQFK